MHRLVAVLAAATTFAASLVPAAAQPAAPVPAPPSAVPPAPVPTPAPTGDPAEVTATYDRAFAALVAGDYGAAAGLFDEVAARSVDPERRGAARELARYARVELRAESATKSEARSSSRAGVVVSSTLAGLYTGFVVDDLLGITDDKGTALVVMGGTTAGLVGSLLATSGKHITEGMESSYTVGLITGLGNGLLWAPVLGIEAEGDCTPNGGCNDGEINQTFLGFGLATMAAGGAAGLYLGHRYDPTGAQARFAGLMAYNGVATVGLGMGLLDINFDGENDDRKTLAVLATGLDLGLAAGIVLGRRLDWSGSRMSYVTLAEFFGGLIGGGTGVLLTSGGDASNSEGQVYAGLILGGLWAGFGAATYLTRNMAPHPRFAAASSTPITLAPLQVEGARGIALSGVF